MCGRKVLQLVRRHRSLLQTAATLLGVAAGVGLALLLQTVKDPREWTPREVVYIKFLGDMHIRFIQALIIPIIVSSMVTALGSLDFGLSKRLFARTLVYYLGTTTLAAVLATLVVIWIRPGVRADGATMTGCEYANYNETEGGGGGSNVDAALDIVRNLFPPNLIGTALESTATKVIDSGDGTPFWERKLEIVMTPATNLLGVISLSLAYGLVIGAMGTEGKPMLDFFTALMSATMKLMQALIWFFPITTCLLLAGQLVQEENIGAIFKTLLWYTVAHTVAYFNHSFLILPLLYFTMTRKNPLKFLQKLAPAIATAFGTASSSATLPVTMECVQNAAGVDERVARFVLPIGATVNMDGSAIYRVVVINYLAQLCGKSIGLGEHLNIGLICIATSVGVAGLPGGAMTILGVLSSLGYPPEHYLLALPVMWLVDRFSTVTNVMGDGFGAAMVLHMSRKDLEKQPKSVASVPVDPKILS